MSYRIAVNRSKVMGLRYAFFVRFLLATAGVKFLLLVLACPAQGQNTAADVAAFRAMTEDQRYRYLCDLPLFSMDSGAVRSMLDRLDFAAVDLHDRRAVWMLQYLRYAERLKLKISQAEAGRLATRLDSMAAIGGFPEEQVVARHANAFEMYTAGKMSHEKLFVELLHNFERMKALGFDRFTAYRVDGLLWEMSQFMYDLEDYDRMLEYLLVAERYIRYTEEGQYHGTLILNYLQSYYQNTKDYGKALDYALKILRFNRELKTDNPEVAWRRQFWQGLASLDIANMLVEQGRMAEAERYADTGYELSKVASQMPRFAAWRAEYDALQVLLLIKLKTGQLDEASALVRRSEEIQKVLDTDPEASVHYFAPLRFLKNIARYHELRGDYAAAMHFVRQAQVLQDSLDRRNDARKFAHLQKRLEIEKYNEKVRMVEREKKLQQSLFFAAGIIFLLLFGLGYSNFRRLQIKGRLTLAERDDARKALDNSIREFREKSEQVETQAAQGERNQYLEQLAGSTILTDKDWQHFRAVFEKVHPNYIAGQKTLYPGLTPAELRYLVLEKLGLSTRDMANMLGVSDGTVRQTRLRLRRKISA